MLVCQLKKEPVVRSNPTRQRSIIELRVLQPFGVLRPAWDGSWAGRAEPWLDLTTPKPVIHAKLPKNLRIILDELRLSTVKNPSYFYSH